MISFDGLFTSMIFGSVKFIVEMLDKKDDFFIKNKNFISFLQENMKRKMKPLKEVVSVPVFARQKNSAQQDYLNDYFFKEISRLLEIVKKTPSYQALPEDKQSDFCAFFSDLLDINKDILFVDEYAVKLKKEIKPECNPLKNPGVSSDDFPFLVQVKIARYLKGVILTPKKRAVIVGKLSPFCAVEDGKFCEMPFNNLEDTVRLFMILNDLA